ncbi:hypothetical protein FIBSPDRAFT_905345, partial [Athelia psychrophila]
VARLDPNGDPLWFTLGKGSEDLILTVIPVLVGGADLMIPGVPLRAGAPLAVGRMALSAEDVHARGERENEKGRGKAVLVLHTWKDCLWETGASGDVPAPQNVVEAAESEQR